jgi:hypothetical protein
MVYGNWAVIIDVVAGLTLCVMLVTGLTMYFRLLGARARAGRSGPFWFAGGWWRSLHRAIAATAAAFLLVVVFSGTLLTVGDLGVFIYSVLHHGVRAGLTVDVSAPLTDTELPDMLHTTLTAYHAANPNGQIKALRLRHFAGMPQGVIVSVTAGEDSRQLAFNAVTGGTASLSGPDYPVTGQPFGWQEDQIAKHIHRGDYIGLSGRWMSLIAGLSLIFSRAPER